MKVLHIAQDWPPPWTNQAPFLYDLAFTQAKSGHTVVILALKDPVGMDDLRLEHVTVIGTYGSIFAPLLRIFPLAAYSTSCVFGLLSYLKLRKKHDFDVIHAHGSFGFWIYGYRCLLKRIFPKSKEFSVPFIVSLAGATTLSPPTALGRLVAKYVNEPLIRLTHTLAIKSATAYVFFSAAAFEACKGNNTFLKEKAVVLSSGINTQMFRPVGQEEKEKTRKDLGVYSGEKLLLYLGALTQSKDIALFAPVLKYLPKDYKLLLVGPYEDKEFEINFYDALKVNGVSEQVLHINSAPYTQTPIAFQAADLYVSFSETKGISKAVFEALATGIPALIYGAELADPLTGLNYMSTKKPDVIAQQIKNLLARSQKVDVAKVTELFSWTEKAKEIDRLYVMAKDTVQVN